MTAQFSLNELFIKLDRFGGAERLGQSQFCLWVALIRKSMKLGWCHTFSMTNAELIYTAGFLSGKGLWAARNRLIQLGLIQYEPPLRGKTMPGRYFLNFDFDQEIPADSNKCFPREITSESLRNSFGITSESLRNQFGITIDKIDDIDDDDTAREVLNLVAGSFCRDLTVAEQEILLALWEQLKAHSAQAPALFTEAVKRCVANGSTKVGYIKAVADRWIQGGVCDLAGVAQSDLEFAKKRKGEKSSGKRLKVMPINDAAEYDSSTWAAEGFTVTDGT